MVMRCVTKLRLHLTPAWSPACPWKTLMHPLPCTVGRQVLSNVVLYFVIPAQGYLSFSGLWQTSKQTFFTQGDRISFSAYSRLRFPTPPSPLTHCGVNGEIGCPLSSLFRRTYFSDSPKHPPHKILSSKYAPRSLSHGGSGWWVAESWSCLSNILL